MDESVVHAMARWPDVPDCYGWLALTRRGEWRIGAGRERIGHHGLSEFINRNYVADAGGAWFFQNGPQRVWVSLDYTPLVFRLAIGEPLRLTAHTGIAVRRIDRALLDADGSLIFVTDLGPGLLDDRDLAAAMPRICGPCGEPFEAVFVRPRAELFFGADRIPIERHVGGTPELALGFCRRPAPATGSCPSRCPQTEQVNDNDLHSTG